MKYTEWFPSHIKPVRVGVYQTYDSNSYQYWNGREWGYISGNPHEAAYRPFKKSSMQDDKWRGLTEPHAEA